MWTPASIKFGAFLAPYHPLTADPALQLRRDIDLMEHLDHLGFDEAWMGEHHSTGAEIVPAPDVFIAAAAERTRRIRFGTGVLSLPYHHPLVTADRITQLDLQTRGRLIVGTGPGKIPLDAHMMGIDPIDQRRMQGEALEAVLRLLRGEVVTMQTDWFTLRDARAQLPTYDPAGIEVATASTISPNGSVLAGTHGLSLLSLAASSPSGFEVLDRNWGVYEKVSAEHGHRADRSMWRVVNPMFLAETRADAERAVSRRIHAIAEYVNRQQGIEPDWAQTPGGIIEQWRTDTLGEFGQVVIGTPEDAIAQIERLIEKTGGFGTLLILHVDMANWEDTVRSYELFASEVIPYFKNRNAGRRASLQFAEDHRDHLIGGLVGAITKAHNDYYGQPVGA
ncbi:Limonene 1,2-monooxygenase [Mycolicibacterium mageritense DSM 44476 = CIP 104973]|uniref:Monooxygenase (Luciferase-like) n=1 Tax=Mycolicibacterium mageritense TaxID=53462 RepID=A0ABM7I0T9_MYCME|nr:LLM class flavin-dependent oxidoreductase [Mycolicibacterium mageritense]MBN3453272.1 LLM class flavin-dependent oxidoreductase [Mycobacterium sp. DSM 3803]OKH74024.1 monooxygenase [Mycobacterium sp. SWH-M3]MCC9180019.1 LLM class flavin-dependent oxidoreductase [Mycolicibacterium mageritense]TXI59327.1 MAG: LLM class flavin-dependent oxidoreductase [Mycolicibacterium mageritense]CDO24570.1 F420-dependent methylene-tetrahydromethanopterin reductase [Mycolicibacterium mageritense DSM 44476 = 